MKRTLKSNPTFTVTCLIIVLICSYALLLKQLWFSPSPITGLIGYDDDVSFKNALGKSIATSDYTPLKSKALIAFNNQTKDAMHENNMFTNHADETALHLNKINDSVACIFPVLDPFAKSIRKFFRRYPTLNCSGGMPSIVDIVDNELKLKINPQKVRRKLNLTQVKGCKYRSIHRQPENDFKLVYGNWSESFNNSAQLSEKDEYLQVDCYNEGRFVGRSYLALLKKRKKTEEKRLMDYHKHVKDNSPKETLSVLLVGIEGTSKQNFIRFMPKTKSFLLDKMKAIEFHKFNKVGYNTFPNIIPLLTGLQENELRNTNWTDKEPFDKIDHLFMWNQYQKSGYRTSFVGDEKYVAEFHYFMKGWANPPFDFYYRPVLLATHEDKLFKRLNENCMGDTPAITSIYDYWLRLATAYNNTPSTPYFGYGLLSHLTHDYQDLASKGDELYLAFFKELVERRVLNNTLLIFFSDHGERFGKIRNTYNGLQESKMPILFFMFPPWFERKYPEVMQNLRLNKNRLTTFFDVHATLKDILYFTGNPQKASPLDRGISLFSEIPANRTCSVAGIPFQFCACNSLQPENITSSHLIRVLVKKLLLKINSYTEGNRSLCHVLELKDTHYIYPLTPELPMYRKNESIYRMSVQTIPGDAVYEASMLFNSGSDTASVIGEVDRLTLFTGQESCVMNAFKLYCFCKNITG